jgi:hypothetical protein
MKLIYFKHGSPDKHPFDVVSEMGVKFDSFENNPALDHCVFHGVSKVPNDLPEYITRK